MNDDADTVVAATAWSQCDPPELTAPLEATHSRWWGVLKMASAALAVGCGAAAAIILGGAGDHPAVAMTTKTPAPPPQSSAAPPTPFAAPTIAAQHQSPDDRYLGFIGRIQGIGIDDPRLVVMGGHKICENMATYGDGITTATQGVAATVGGPNLQQARAIVTAAVTVYCPQFAERP